VPEWWHGPRPHFLIPHRHDCQHRLRPHRPLSTPMIISGSSIKSTNQK
jgi:hypothetical protein